MFFWGKRKVPIECCYCATRDRYADDVDKFTCCNRPIPPHYRQFHREAIPFFVPLVGWSEVGKTVWLLSILRRLHELPTTIWPGFAPLPANDITMHYKRLCEGVIRSREMPPATLKGGPEEQEAYVIVMKEMPTWGKARTLVIRDVSGENFEQFNVPEDQLSFLRNSRTSFFMFSLQDIEASENKSMEELLNCYLHSLLKKIRGDIKRERRKIIVVITKTDQLKLPAHLQNYLESDPMAQHSGIADRKPHGPREMAEYIERMERVSNDLRDWLVQKHNAQVMINVAQQYNIELRFTAVSATGSTPVTQTNEDGSQVLKLERAWTPLRALDPLFWALHLHSA